MLPQTPFIQHLPPRIMQARDRLKRRIWQVDPTQLAVRQSPSHDGFVSAADAEKLEYTPVEVGDVPHVWGRMFQQCWWKVNIPANQTGGRRYLRWIDQAEATVYLGNVPHYGVDPGHHYAPLPDSLDKGGEIKIESHCIRSGVWVTGEPQGIGKGGSEFCGAFITRRNDDAWQAWLDLESVLQVLALEFKHYHPVRGNFSVQTGYRAPIERISPLYRKLIRRVDAALDAMEQEGDAAMHAAMQKVFEDFKTDPLMPTAILTGHAHIDLVWKWPERSAEFKAVHSFANANWLMEQYPEFRFGYTQTASYSAVARRSPEMFEQVKKRVQQGKWDATGVAEVEMDTQLPVGEALGRCMVLGQKQFAEIRGGSIASVLWIPDVFGYTGCLPAVIKQAGAEYFFTTKLTWNDSVRFPFSSFRWRGTDGTEVVTHVTLAVGYNSVVDATELQESALFHQQTDIHDEFLYPCGYGDGGGGPTDEMCERARRFANLSTLPRVRWGNIETFFDGLAKKANELPVYTGEIYLSYHRGVQTTHDDLKNAFRAAERALQAAEAVRCATDGEPIDEHPWRRVCFAQFHDYIPGSSIREVYEEGVPELRKIADDLYATCESELGKGGDEALFNPLPHVQTVRVGDGIAELPPLSGRPVAQLKAKPRPAAKTSASGIESERIVARFDHAGRITDLIIDGHALELAGPANELLTFVDLPHSYDAWDIDRHTLTMSRPAEDKAKASVDGEAVIFSRKLTDKSTCRIRYEVDPCHPVLRITYDVDWQDEQTILKATFPTRYNGKDARYGAPFGSVLRGQQYGELQTEMKFENPFSRWMAVCDDTESDGLAVITESKYGGGAFAGLLHVSLLKSALVTDSDLNENLRTRQNASHYADMGQRQIHLAIGRHCVMSPRPEQPAALADLLFTPPIAYRGKAIDGALLNIVGGETLQPAWAKPIEPGKWVLRLHETMGRRGTAEIQLADGWRVTNCVDLLERPNKEGQVDGHRITFRPYELIGLMIEKK